MYKWQKCMFHSLIPIKNVRIIKGNVKCNFDYIKRVDRIIDPCLIFKNIFFLFDLFCAWFDHWPSHPSLKVPNKSSTKAQENRSLTQDDISIAGPSHPYPKYLTNPPPKLKKIDHWHKMISPLQDHPIIPQKMTAHRSSSVPPRETNKTFSPPINMKNNLKRNPPVIKESGQRRSPKTI